MSYALSREQLLALQARLMRIDLADWDEGIVMTALEQRALVSMALERFPVIVTAWGKGA